MAPKHLQPLGPAIDIFILLCFLLHKLCFLAYLPQMSYYYKGTAQVLVMGKSELNYYICSCIVTNITNSKQ